VSLSMFFMFSIIDFVNNHEKLFETTANMSLCACAFLNLTFLHRLGSLVGPFAHPFVDYAKNHRFLHTWAKGGVRRLFFTISLWVVGTSSTCISSFVSTGEHITLPMTSFRDGCLLASIHCLWQILAFLEIAVDRYCAEFSKHHNCQVGVCVWNGLQALLRRVAEVIENCFLTIQSTMIIAVLCCAGRLVTVTINLTTHPADVDDVGMILLGYVQVLLTAFATIALFAKAASVTEKCSRVPALINSMVPEDGDKIDHERQYLVTYIRHSDAGFYVKGSRFTAAMLVKFCYLLGTVICGLGSTVLTIAKSA